MQNFVKIPKTPTLRLHKSCIQNANQSILSPNIKSLWHSLHRKKKQPNPSSYEGVMAVQSWSKVAVMLSKQNFSKSGKCAENGFDQFLELHNLSHTYPNQLIIEPNCREKWGECIGKRLDSFGYRMQAVERFEVGSKPILNIFVNYMN